MTKNILKPLVFSPKDFWNKQQRQEVQKKNLAMSKVFFLCFSLCFPMAKQTYLFILLSSNYFCMALQR